MSPFIISKQSWHFRLIDKWKRKNSAWDRTVWWFSLTLCDYVKCLAIAALGLFVYYSAITLLIVLAAMAIGSGLLAIGLAIWLMPQALWTGDFSHPSVFPGIALTVLLSVWYGLPAYLDHRERKRNRKQDVTQKSFVGQAYDSWKHKYCIPVQVVDTNKQ